jgi:hypothetical protein
VLQCAEKGGRGFAGGWGFAHQQWSGVLFLSLIFLPLAPTYVVQAGACTPADTSLCGGARAIYSNFPFSLLSLLGGQGGWGGSCLVAVAIMVVRAQLFFCQV